MAGTKTCLAALLLPALMLFSACDLHPGKQQADDLKTLNRGGRTGSSVVKIPGASSLWDQDLMNDMFVGLFARNAEGKIIPGMASSYTVSDDGLVWTFNLRAANWSDGKPVTANDFVFALQQQFNPHALEQTLLILSPLANAKPVSEGKLPTTELGISAPDARTLQIRLAHPVPDLPGLFSHPVTFPMPRHVVEEWGPEWTLPSHIVVNGPYRQVENAKGGFVRLVRNKEYFGNETVCTGEVRYFPAENRLDIYKDVQDGKLDIASAVPVHQTAMLQQEMPTYLHVLQILSTDYIAFNLRKPPFNDVRVRQALSMSMDRNALIHDALKARQVPAYTLVPPGIRAYGVVAKPDWTKLTMDQRRQKARQLLQDAGYGPDHPLEFTYTYLNDYLHAPVAQAEQKQWDRLAPWVHAKIAPELPSRHYANLRTGDFNIADALWLADYDDPYNFLQLMRSDSHLNYSGYFNSEYDQLLDQANRQKSADERASLLRTAESKLLDDAAIMPVWFNVSVSLVSPKVQGWKDNGIDNHPSQYLCKLDSHSGSPVQLHK